MPTPQPIRDNPTYFLHYQLDEMSVVRVRVEQGPLSGLGFSFIRLEHGCGNLPFLPLMLSMQ